MGNKEDWEEIQKWQQQQDEKSKKYMNFEEFNMKSKNNLDILNAITTFGIKSALITSIGIGIAVLVFAFITIYALFYIVTPKNVLKSLEELYKGEKFEIVEDFGAKNSSSRGLYIVSPKSNKNIQFKMLNTSQVRSDNDYSAQRTKYYVEHCQEPELLEDVIINERYQSYKGVNFLLYTLIIELDDYSHIEEKAEKAYKLAKYLHSQDNRMDESIFLDIKDITYGITIRCDTQKSLEEEIYSVKYEYIQALYDNNKKEELQKIGQEEIDKIWKPKYLQLIVNEKETIGKALYNLEDKKYYLVNISKILKQLDQLNKIEILKTDVFSQEIKKIKYNDKTYKIEYGSYNGKNKNDVLYKEESIDGIFQKLNLGIMYDYDNQKIYITMKY